MSKMNPEIKAKWLEALRSGEYQQGRRSLHADGSYCCLGVLCDISNLDTWKHRVDGIYAYFDCEGFLPSTVADWAGLESRGAYGDEEVNHLAEDNDNGKSFLEIADIIEEYF